MSLTIATRIKHFIRGGQTFLHDVHMFAQVLWKLLLLAPIVVVASMVIWWFVAVEKTEQQFIYQMARIEMQAFIHPKTEKSPAKKSAFYDEYLESMSARVLHALWMSIALYMVAMIGIILWLKRYGRRAAKHEVLRGVYLAPLADCRKQLKDKKLASDITLGQLPLIKNSETAHIFIHGTTGTGKSVCFYELLDHIRRRGERAIIYDKSGGFFAHYYRANQDVLLNPLDQRSQDWDVWSECRERPDYDTLAAALIPMPVGTHDPFWINAARTLFAVTAYQLAGNPERSMDFLLKKLFSSDLNALQQLVQGTEAEVLVSGNMAKTALSIKSVLAAALKSLLFLNSAQHPFSIRQWIENESNHNWLFVTSRADQHATLRPLISTWLDVAANAVMSLPPDPKRRIWLCLDELPSLQQLPSLTPMLAESRKFGGCVALTVQSIAQLQTIYGKDGAEALSDLCSTRIFFRSPSSTTAHWVSKELGESELLEAREGISYGAHLSRDGVSMARSRVTTPVVMATDIEQLPNLQAYVRLPGISTQSHAAKTWPITKMLLEPQARPATCLAFIAKPKAEDVSSHDSIDAPIAPYSEINIDDIVAELI